MFVHFVFKGVFGSRSELIQYRYENMIEIFR